MHLTLKCFSASLIKTCTYQRLLFAQPVNLHIILNMGEKGGKSDMDRVGVFQEMGYITINDKYRQLGSGNSYLHIFLVSRQFLRYPF